MHYIETLREGERVNEIYLCKNKQKASLRLKYALKVRPQNRDVRFLLQNGI